MWVSTILMGCGLEVLQIVHGIITFLLNEIKTAANVANNSADIATSRAAFVKKLNKESDVIARPRKESPKYKRQEYQKEYSMHKRQEEEENDVDLELVAES